MTAKEKRKAIRSYVYLLIRRNRRKLYYSYTHIHGNTYIHSLIKIFIYDMVHKHGSTFAGQHCLRRKNFF